jgi:hypothetical protein
MVALYKSKLIIFTYYFKSSPRFVIYHSARASQVWCLTTLFLIYAKSYYQSTTTYNSANATPLTVNDILNSFLGAPDNAGVVGKGANLTTLQSSNIGQTFSNFIRGANGTSSTIPKAFINYIFFLMSSLNMLVAILAV